MKKMKRIVALLLAVMLVLGMTMTAFAAQQGEEPVDNKVSAEKGGTPDISTHKYVAYKIFDGTQAEDKAELASITWADEKLGAEILDAIIADPTIGSDFKTGMTAREVAEKVSGYEGEQQAKAKAFARCVYDVVNAKDSTGTLVFTGTPITIGDLMPTGYYLIVDIATTDEDGENQDYSAYNLALLQLTNRGRFEIQNKTDVPEVKKKVQEKNDSTGYESGWQDAADHDLGDYVPFMLTGTLPSNYDDYASYKYVFHDTLSAGLTFNNDVEVYIDSEEGTEITDYFDVDAENGTITIACANLKAIETLTSSNNIVVFYTAELNDSAVIGAPGNPNDVYLQYSNNPNWRGSGDNGDDEDEEEPTGNTPPDRVIVFTYEIDANKVDDAGAALAGAGFTLYKWIENEDTDGETAGEGDTTVETGKWEQIRDEIKDVTTFEFKHIDAGRYKLVETTVPAGYNKADDIIFVVKAAYTGDGEDEDDNPSLTDLVVTDANGDPLLDDEEKPIFTVTRDSGLVSTKVVNMSGITLPETGGIGTTIFYVVGGVLVVGCGVVLLTRKRIRK